MKDKVSITFLITSMSSLSSLPSVLEDIETTYGDLIDLAIYYVDEVESNLIPDERVLARLGSSDVIMAVIMTNGKSIDLLKEAARSGDPTIIPLIASTPELLKLTKMGSFTMEQLNVSRGATIDVAKMKDLDGFIEKLTAFLTPDGMRHARNWVNALSYWSNPGPDNLKNLLLFVAEKYGGLASEKTNALTYEPPIVFPSFGIYNPFMPGIYTDVSDYWKTAPCDPSKPTVGLLYYGGMHFDASVAGARALIERLRGQVNVLPVFTDGIQNLAPLSEYFAHATINGDAADLIVSLIWFRLNGGPMGGAPEETLALLKKLDAPLVVPAMLYLREIARWEESAGLSPVETLATVTFPEMDGGIEPIPCLGLIDLNNRYGVDIKPAAVIDDRADRICARLLNWLRLRSLPNSAKKVAIILYDYPPGEANIGGAAYLDTFASIERILAELKEAGYAVELPDVSLREFLLSHGTINSPEWTDQETSRRENIRVRKPTYFDWFNALPPSIAAQVTRDWGPPPGHVMTYRGSVLLPLVTLGNVAIGLQPSRGIHEDPTKAYHDKVLTPHHQYIAFYKYLQEEFKADVVVHVGTHGTLEFLPGKEVGMSSQCAPDQLIGDIPHLYLYHVTNPSEAMIAKRRSYGTIVNYMSPAFARSDLYADYLELEDLIAEYESLVAIDAERAGLLEEDICGRADALSIEYTSLHDIRAELFEMKRSIIPQGLHRFGELPKEECLVDFLTFVLCVDRGKQKSLLRLVLEAAGLDYEQVLRSGDEGLISGAEEKMRRIVREHILPHDDEGDATDGSDAGLDLSTLAAVCDYGRKIFTAMQESDEIGSLLHALDGRYVYPNLAGDPIRTPEVLPTGSNSYQFDPQGVPTALASRRGTEIADNTIAAFMSETRRYPETVGVVLWGFETAKTHGETVGQLFSYLGLRVVKGKAWYAKLEVVPLAELGRPRVDVNVTICGFFRDLFPNLVSLIDQGIRKVATLDEPEDLNYVKRHARELQERLRAEGVVDEQADVLSTARLYGPSSGQYGTNLTNIIETSNWTDESQLADEFIADMAHAYGEGLHGVDARASFTYMLETTELTSQVRDTHEYEISDLDHYYEFYGGLTKATERVRGAKPLTLITDTTGELIKTKSASSALKRGVNTRLLNPKWLDPLLEHDFHGAQKVAERVEYLIGFAATIGVESQVFSRVAERLVFDQETLKRLIENNQYVTHAVMERLVEAHRRGFWEATEDELEQLKNAYLSLDDMLER